MIRVDTGEAPPSRFPKLSREDIKRLDKSLRFLLTHGPGWLRPKPAHRRRRAPQPPT